MISVPHEMFFFALSPAMCQVRIVVPVGDPGFDNKLVVLVCWTPQEGYMQ
jgi:hypothetical protein